MKTATVREFRDRATNLLNQEEPVVVTRHGKIVGFYLPAVSEALPLEIKRDVFSTLTDEIQASMKSHHFTEATILANFEKSRRTRRRR
jgi:hypothetical protein